MCTVYYTALQSSNLLLRAHILSACSCDVYAIRRHTHTQCVTWSTTGDKVIVGILSAWNVLNAMDWITSIRHYSVANSNLNWLAAAHCRRGIELISKSLRRNLPFTNNFYFAEDIPISMQLIATGRWYSVNTLLYRCPVYHSNYLFRMRRKKSSKKFHWQSISHYAFLHTFDDDKRIGIGMMCFAFPFVCMAISHPNAEYHTPDAYVISSHMPRSNYANLLSLQSQWSLHSLHGACDFKFPRLYVSAWASEQLFHI